MEPQFNIKMLCLAHLHLHSQIFNTQKHSIQNEFSLKTKLMVFIRLIDFRHHRINPFNFTNLQKMIHTITFRPLNSSCSTTAFSKPSYLHYNNTKSAQTQMHCVNQAKIYGLFSSNSKNWNWIYRASFNMKLTQFYEEGKNDPS